MTYRQYILDYKFHLLQKNRNKALDAVVESIKKVHADNGGRWPRDGVPEFISITDAFEYFGFDAITGEEPDICALDLLIDGQDDHQMLLFEAIAPFVEPGNYITMMGEDQHLWQWFFDNGEIYTREVATRGIITSPEDADRLKANRKPEVGYRYCQCRDCMELVVGEPGEYCYECIEAGCPDYQGKEGMSQECRAGDAYSE
jgi:hypothetical protein